MAPCLILASASPRRKWLLEREGITFKVVPSHVEEGELPGLTPVETAATHARNKALAVAPRFPDHMVLGADTIVVVGDLVLGKPADMQEADRMLALLQDRSHNVVTAVHLLALNDGIDQAFHVASTVHFRPLDAPARREYLSLINPMDKAGAYAAQEHADLIIKHIDGPLSNVIGLPVEHLRDQSNFSCFLPPAAPDDPTNLEPDKTPPPDPGRSV